MHAYIDCYAACHARLCEYCSSAPSNWLSEAVLGVQMDVKEHQGLFDTNYFGVVCLMADYISTQLSAAQSERSCRQSRQTLLSAYQHRSRQSIPLLSAMPSCYTALSTW